MDIIIYSEPKVTYTKYTEIPKIYGTYNAPRDKEKIDTYTYKEAGRRGSKRAQ